MDKKHGRALTLFILSLCLIIISISYCSSIYGPTRDAKKNHEDFFSTQKKEFIPVIVIFKKRPGLQETSFDKNKDGSVEIIVEKLKKTACASEEEIWPVLEKEIDKGNIKNYRPFWIVNAFAAQINEEAFRKLSALPEIESIRPEQQYSLLTHPAGYIPAVPTGNTALDNPAANREETLELPWNIEAVGAPSVWQKGIYGKEVVVAIMDTGVDPSHPALKEHYRGHLQNHSHETSWHDATAEDVSANSGPSDNNGHGTHIAGIILGGSPQEPQGVAPGAHWIAVNIFDRGYAWDSHIIQAFQWLMAPGGDPQNAPQIINCSWASQPEYVRDYLQWEILHALEEAGIFVVFAAGNNATSGPGSPASYPHAFSVGALKKEDGIVKIADFSSRGPVSWQEITYTKPEITAPGVNIRSTWPNNGYTVLDGTSLAAAHVSGVAALLLESRPDLSPLEIKYILKHSAKWDNSWNATGKRPNNTYGYGLLDAYEAINRNVLPSRETLFYDGVEEGIINWHTSADTPWKITREKVYEGNFSLASSPWEHYPNNFQSWLAIAKPLSLGGYHTPILSFQHFYDLATGKNKEDDCAYVEISVDGENWASMYRFSGTNEKFHRFSLPINLPPETNAFYIRFRLESKGNGPGRGWYLDNIRLSAVPLPLTDLDRLKLDPVKNKIGVGDSTIIDPVAVFDPAHLRKIPADQLNWSSSNPAIAIVDNGIVWGLSPGKTIISGQFAGRRTEIEIEVIEVLTPKAQPAPGTYVRSATLELVPTTPGAEIYYTLDGSEPDEKSTLYEKPVTITENTTVKAKEYYAGIPGPTKEFTYIIEEGAIVSGCVTLQGRLRTDSELSVFFVNEESKQVYAVPNLSVNGEFSMELPLGSYKLTAKRKQYLAKTIAVKLETKEEIRDINLQLLAGDLNNDNRIDITDLTVLSLAYRSKPGDKHWNPLADLNGDGKVDILDLTMLTKNYGQRSGDM